MKTITFRFDVDTHLCMQEGMLNLLDLADTYDIEFTFFINMGKGLSISGYVNNIFKEKVPNVKLSNLEKLGITGFLEALILNPLVGSSNYELINALNKNGHELGLHGGKNHGTWLYYSHTWDKKRFFEEIAWGLSRLTQIDSPDIKGFASPGWKGSKICYQVLDEMGFKYVADSHGKKGEMIRQHDDLNLSQIRTNVLGEPGGVGYFEHCRARGWSDGEILHDLSGRIEKENSLIIYDHPYYAGAREIPLLEKIIQRIHSRDLKICRMMDIFNHRSHTIT